MNELPTLNLDVATTARVYDDLFRGKDNYDVDRELAAGLRERCPQLPAILHRANQFVREAVARLVDEGITQFVDVGTGYPREPFLHAEILAWAPQARIVYLDNDLLVGAHTRALMLPCEAVSFVWADITDTAGLGAPNKLGEFLDLSKPVALVAESVLEFLPGAAEVLAAMAELLAPGSRLVISHLASDLCPEVGLLREVFSQAGIELYPRDRDELAEMLTGYTLTDPGIMPLHEWAARAEQFSQLPRQQPPGCYGVIAEVR
ncbi:SAM-dependent methyltransferase [Nocardia sp. NBC_01388]|uniref:SAM-dependent methyltransferase n=1 Tax=Nocardia sp. NBC_01388 TaxID=2903596 RepID=UPI003252A90E